MSYFHQQRSASTLAELLVWVVVLIGVFLVIWFVLQPMEIIAKAKDTRLVDQADDLLKGIEDYVIQKGYYPWNDEKRISSNKMEREYYYDPEDSSLTLDWFDRLVAMDELKENIATQLRQNQQFYLYKDEGNVGSALVYLCFEPFSKQYQLKAAKNCDETLNQRTAPVGNRLFKPCDTTDGTVPTETGLRNLYCVVR